MELDRWVTKESVVRASDHGQVTSKHRVCNSCAAHAPAEVAARKADIEAAESRLEAKLDGVNERLDSLGRILESMMGREP